MPEELVTCPVCLIPNFTARGLKAHKCKGATRRDAETIPVEVLPPAEPSASSLLSSVSPSSVSDLVATINDHHTRAQNDAAHAKAYGESAVQAAILAGLQLVELKAVTPHGHWEAMFTSGAKRVGKANVNHGCHLDFGYETARKYVSVATQLVSKKLQPEQSAVLMELARGGPMTPAAAELLTEITPAKSLRQTYLELGIVKPTPKEAAWLSYEPSPAPTGPAEPKAAATFRSAKDSARIDWFGTPKLGRVEPGSLVGMVLNELTDPARGTLRLLGKEDLEAIAEDLRRFAKLAAEYAREK